MGSLLTTKAKGDAGLNYNVAVHENTNELAPELQGRQGSFKYKIMSSNDSTVGMILRIYKNPIRSAIWTIPEIDDGKTKDILAADVLRAWFFDKSPLTFGALLTQILSLIEYGFSCFERIWVPFKYNGQTYLMPDLQQRLQPSIEDVDIEKGIVKQQTIKSGLAEIPLADMVFFTLNAQGQDMRGESLLRTAYKDWETKNIYREYQGIGIQRGSTGVPSMKIPKGIDVGSADYLAVASLLQNITAHENAYMIFPEGYEFKLELLNFDPSKLQTVIDALDSKMTVSVLTQFVLLGQGGAGGAYALSQDQSDLFLDGLKFIVTLIEETFYRQVIVPAVSVNFGEAVSSDAIRLKGLNLNKKVGQELSTVLTNLKNGSFIKPTLNDEIFLRKTLELPDLTEDEIETHQAALDSVPAPASILPNDKAKEPVKLSEGKASATKDRDSLVDLEIKQMTDLMKANLYILKDKFVADIKNTLNRGSISIKGLQQIEVNPAKYKKALERKLSGVGGLGWNMAAKDAKQKNIKLSEAVDLTSLTSKELRVYILNEVESVVDDQVSSMVSRAVLTASNGPLKGLSNVHTLANVNAVIDIFIDSNAVSAGSAILTVGTLNFGETLFYKQIEDQLWGYEFVNGDPVSEICQWYDGKTFSINSPELAQAMCPLHPNCKSRLVPIYKSEVPDKPTIDDVVAPPSIQKSKTIY